MDRVIRFLGKLAIGFGALAVGIASIVFCFLVTEQLIWKIHPKEIAVLIQVQIFIALSVGVLGFMEVTSHQMRAWRQTESSVMLKRRRLLSNATIFTALGMILAVGFVLSADRIDDLARAMARWLEPHQNLPPEQSIALPETTPGSIEMLQSSNERAQLDAIIALEKRGRGVSAAAPDLARLLERSRYGEIRLNAALALGAIGTEALPLVTDVMDRGDKDSKYYALTALGAMRAEALPALDRVLACLKDADPELRLKAVTVLGQMKPPLESAVPALFALCSKSWNDNGVSTVASIQVLASYGDRMVPMLLQKIQEAHASGQGRIALHVLQAMGPDGAAAIDGLGAILFAPSVDRQLVQGILTTLPFFGARALPILQRAMDHDDDWISSLAFGVVQDNFEIHEEMLLDLSRHRNPSIRAEVIQLLRNRDFDRIAADPIHKRFRVLAIVERLGDSNLEVRDRAREYFLNRRGEPFDLKHLSADRETLRRALAIIGTSDDRRGDRRLVVSRFLDDWKSIGLSSVLALLGEDDSNLRYLAFERLAEARFHAGNGGYNSLALETLTEHDRKSVKELLRSKNDETRWLTVEWMSLNQEQGAKWTDELTAALRDSYAPARYRAAIALQQVPGRNERLNRLLNDLDAKSADVQAEARRGLEALAAVDRETMVLLVDQLTRPNPSRREQVALVLGLLGERAKASLYALRDLAANDPDDNVRRRAAEAIQRIELR
jgi:HEAT repeat protein